MRAASIMLMGSMLDGMFTYPSPQQMRIGRTKAAKHSQPNKKRAKVKAARKQNRRKP